MAKENEKTVEQVVQEKKVRIECVIELMTRLKYQPVITEDNDESISVLVSDNVISSVVFMMMESLYFVVSTRDEGRKINLTIYKH